MGKPNKKGRYLQKVGFYDIYAKDNMIKNPEGRGKHNQYKIGSTSIDIWHGKNLVKVGFKSKQQAINYIENLK